MTCPLCEEQKYFTLRRDKVKDLSRQWQNNFGFNPLSNTSSDVEINKQACVECGLIYFSPSIFGDGEFYSRLSKNDWYYESDKWEFDVAVQVAAEYKPKSILEIGCGAGEFLQKVASGVDYSLGIDINESALLLAREKGLVVTSQSIEKLEKSFDMIVLFQVLEHLDEPGKILSEIERKLNPGGILIIAVPNPDGYLKECGVVLLDMPPHHNTGWGKITFDWLASYLKMDFMQYETEPLRYVHYQGYVSSLISRNAKKTLLRKAQQAIAKVLMPFLFLFGGNKIVGQTHLAVFKKPISS